MKIRLADIPNTGKSFDGRDFSFELDAEGINKRVNLTRVNVNSQTVPPPPYIFANPIKCSVNLSREGSTVFFKGTCESNYSTPCSRCSEDLERSLSFSLNQVLKPTRRESSSEKVDDVSFSYYEDKEIDCATVVEERLMLEIPYVVRCEFEDPKDCPNAEVARKYMAQEEKKVDERFAVLKDLKLVQ
jgi:uncharacterized metal-binding protein YceD (DUF177 family)